VLHGGSAAGRGPGASVVIPSFRGAAALEPTLAALAAQTLAPDRFEVVVVVNGPAALEREPFEALRARWPDHRMRLVLTETAGASLAWNIGVQASRMEWLTFVDDDDTTSPRFLEALLGAARPGIVPLTEIHDVHADGSVDESGSLNQRIRAVAGTTVAAARLPQACGFNASKLVPTRWAKAARYGTAMTNGQDVAYFGTLSLRHDIVFAVPADARDAAYLRGYSDTSMSRQALSFEFSIEQRLEVIETLDRERRGESRSRRAVADHLVKGQVSLMNRYLREHLDERQAVLDAIRRRNLSAFPYRALAR
jgi:glycosyltransferase involved in cell wall biosynthesis